jgi:hypothetical protein
MEIDRGWKTLATKYVYEIDLPNNGIKIEVFRAAKLDKDCNLIFPVRIIMPVDNFSTITIEGLFKEFSNLFNSLEWRFIRIILKKLPSFQGIYPYRYGTDYDTTELIATPWNDEAYAQVVIME